MRRTQNTDIADAAYIGHHTGSAWARKYGLMIGRHQRRTLTAGGDVATTKICHHGNARQFGEQGGVVDLSGVAQGRLVPNGLAMNPYGAYGTSRQPR